MSHTAVWPYVSISNRKAFACIVEVFLRGIAIPRTVHVRTEALGEPPALKLHAIYPTTLANGADPSTQGYQQTNEKGRARQHADNGEANV